MDGPPRNDQVLGENERFGRHPPRNDQILEENERFWEAPSQERSNTREMIVFGRFRSYVKSAENHAKTCKIVKNYEKPGT